MLLFAVANCVQWAHTFSTSGDIGKEIFTGFTGLPNKNAQKYSQVKCGVDSGLTCGEWKEKTSIMEYMSPRSKWQDKFRSAVADILDVCKQTAPCKAVNFDWVAICSHAVDGLISCTKADDYDNVGIVLAYQLVFAHGDYSIILSSSENYWKAGNNLKQMEITMLKKIWEMA